MIHNFQNYKNDNCVLLVCHDGKNSEYATFFNHKSSQNKSINYIDTGLENSSRDWGATPRIKAIEWLIENITIKHPSFICFWDDDNLYTNDYFAEMSKIPKLDQYDLLLVPMLHAGKFVPTETDKEESPLEDIDTSTIIYNSTHLNSILDSFKRFRENSKGMRGQDKFVFNQIINKNSNYYFLKTKPLVVYDGLRLLQMIRWRLRIPSLGLRKHKIIGKILFWLRS